MKAMRHLYVLVVLTVLLSSPLIFTAIADAQAIHALLVIMEDAPRTRQLNQVNQKNIEKLLQRVKDQHNTPLTVDVLPTLQDGNPLQASGENILKWLEAVRPEPDDVVLVYYSGGGGVDKAAARQLFLTLQGGNFPRKQIGEAIDRLACRLKMLITDIVNFDAIYSGSTSYMGAPSLEGLGPLFFEHEGFLNITSASEGELSGGASSSGGKMADEEILQGGWFTYALTDQIYTDYIDRNEDGFVSWAEVFQGTREETMNKFWATAGNYFSEGLTRKLERIGQQTQRPIYYGELPRRIEEPVPQTLYALVVSMERSLLDTDDPFMQARDEIEWLLDDLAETASCHVDATHLFASEGQATPARIQQWLQAVRPEPDDVVLLYYVGDGGADENGELYLNLLDTEKMSRKATADAMQKLACRLKIFITDVGSQGPPVTAPVDFFAPRFTANLSNGVLRAEMFKHLFLEHEGFLNLTAATEGEFAVEEVDEGRLFTRALVHAIYKYDDYRSPFISWSDVFKLTRQKTMDLFHEQASQFPDEMKRQLREKRVESQRPKFYGELPRRIER